MARKKKVGTVIAGEDNIKSDQSSQSDKKESSNTSPTIKEKLHYEFGGPIGAFGVIFGLPLVIYMLFFLCNKDYCIMSFSMDELRNIPQNVFKNFDIRRLISVEAIFIYIGWMVFHLLLERILPGEVAYGVDVVLSLPDRSHGRLIYTMSGHLQFWVTLVAMGHAVPLLIESAPNVYSFSGFRPLGLQLIYDHYLQLITVSIIGAFLLSIYLYVSSFNSTRADGKGKILAKGGDTGSLIYDFFIGRELNPRIGNLDLKEFCELRPGLIGWFVINLGMAFKQYQNRKLAAGLGHGSISFSMLLICLFQGFYVWDALYNERAILTTMDITTDGFGYMLAFGDLAWVPFIYSLQARYLVDFDPNLQLWQIAAISFVHFLGYYIFRSANSEKDSFRRDPNADEVKHLKFMQTKRGTKLLISGWWGMARKINYTGDWLVTLSWCLLCGFKSPIPYFQALYFLILLVHRAIRDDNMCAEKYGDDWVEYKKKVPYLFIPMIC